MGPVAVAHGPSCLKTCGILLDQRLNAFLLHWQVGSSPLSHQGGLKNLFFFFFYVEHVLSHVQLCNLMDCSPPGSSVHKILQAYVDPAAAAAAKSLQSCPTLCNPIDGSPLGSPVPGILQARTLEWVAISFSSAWR